MTYAEHLACAKQRALAYLPGDLNLAWASMVSDLGKHPETRGRIGVELGLTLMRAGHLSTPEQMGKFIEGFR
jgi:hypothetical protein